MGQERPPGQPMWVHGSHRQHGAQASGERHALQRMVLGREIHSKNGNWISSHATHRHELQVD